MNCNLKSIRDDLDNNNNKGTGVAKRNESCPFMEPAFRYVCHDDITKIRIYESELQWKQVFPDGTICSPHVVTPQKSKKQKRNTITQWLEDEDESSDEECDHDGVPVEPAFVPNEAMIALLKSFSRGFQAALLAIEDMYPAAGEQATVQQRAWQQQTLHEGINQLKKCNIEHILFMYRDDAVYKVMPALRDGYFANLVTNLKETGHFAIAFDVCTEAEPDGNYHIVVRHGRMHEIGEPTSYWLYGAEAEDEKRNLP